MRATIQEPAALLLNEALLELQRSCVHVSVTNLDFISDFEGQPVSEGCYFMTFDISSVYPNMLVFGDGDRSVIGFRYFRQQSTGSGFANCPG